MATVIAQSCPVYIERAPILSKRSGRLNFELSSHSRMRETSKIHISSDSRSQVLTREELRSKEVENILAALHRSNGKISGPGGAAEILRMRPSTLASRVKSLGLKKTFAPLQKGEK